MYDTYLHFKLMWTCVRITSFKDYRVYVFDDDDDDDDDAILTPILTDLPIDMGLFFFQHDNLYCKILCIYYNTLSNATGNFSIIT